MKNCKLHLYLSYLDFSLILYYNSVMSSEYRVIRTNNTEVSFSIHEVFKDSNGIITHMDENPVDLTSNNLTTLTQKLILLVSSLTNDVIDKESFNTDFSKSQQEAMDIFKNV